MAIISNPLSSTIQSRQPAPVSWMTKTLAIPAGQRTSVFGNTVRSGFHRGPSRAAGDGGSRPRIRRPEGGAIREALAARWDEINLDGESAFRVRGGR
jgi:hypothetical protein